MRREFSLTLVALALFALTACEKEPASVHDGERYPILFGNYETRATAGLDDLKTYGFKVYAYFTGNTGNSHTFEKEVTYSSTQNVWGYAGLEYWIPGATYWFKAFYPTMPSGTLTVDNTSSIQPFTIADFDISQQEDIMVATAKRTVDNGATCPTGGSVVDLDFQHLLACVAIELKSEIDGVTINSIKISDIADYGTYEELQWSSSNKTSITVEPNVELSKGEEYVDVTNGGILVIPAEANGVTLSISTSSKNYDNIKIPAINWEIGNKYTYTIEIQQNDIILNNPNVAKWDSDSATGSVIIK